MKLDVELVRDILLQVEAAPLPYRDGNMIQLPDLKQPNGVSDQDFDEHVRLLSNAGYLELYRAPMGLPPLRPVPERLTWEGHKYLDGIRSPKVWAKVKELSVSTLGTLTMEGVKHILPKAIDAIMKSQGLG